MVVPLIPVLAGVGIGGIAGGALGMLGGKKEQNIVTHAPYEIYQPTISTVYHKPYETFAPQVLYSPQVSYAYQGAQYIISSPGAQTKKEQAISETSQPQQKGAWELPQTYTVTPEYTTTQAAGGTTGTNFVTLAIIGVIGLVAYGLASGRKKK
jgi:hypothetical protein